MAHFSCFSNAQQSRQRRDEMPIFSRKGVNCEGAPALTFSYLLTYSYNIHYLNSQKNGAKTVTKKLSGKLAKLLQFSFEELTLTLDF